MKNTNKDDGNIVWLGSADGLTPDANYDCNTFELSVTLEIHSGESSGVMFRTGECSTTVAEGPAYYVGLLPDDDKVVFGAMDDGWTKKHSASVSLKCDKQYTLTIQGTGNLYCVYIDGTAVLEDVESTEFSSGSIGLMTYNAPTTYHSVSYQCYDPTPSPTEKPTEEALFVLSDTSMTWSEAEAYCVGLGMHLASIHSDAENEEANQLCSSSCWIGLHCTGNTQYDFEWTDGSACDYSNWATGEPNNFLWTNEDCVHMWSWGSWNDIACTWDKKALCRVPDGMFLEFICTVCPLVPEVRKPTKIYLYFVYYALMTFTMYVHGLTLQFAF